jgi:hypothetical protein
MKYSVIALLIFAQTFSSAEEPVAMTKPKPAPVVRVYQAPRAWLGLQVSKPDLTITAQLPSLPQGVGFVVKSIDENGPAEKAGLVNYDLIWKLDDQLLINESQLATLLRLYKSGDEIKIHGFRGGKHQEFKLILGNTPVAEDHFSSSVIENALMPDDPIGPMRVVNVAEKSASFSTENGRANVRRDGETLKVKIETPTGEAIFEGDFTKDEGFDRVPEIWRRRIEVLCRALDQTLSGSMIPRRQPRPRVIPPPAQPKISVNQ